MVIKLPIFKKYINWQNKEKFSRDTPFSLRLSLLVKLPYEIVFPIENCCIDLRDIDNFVQDEWSAFTDERKNQSHYFFKLEGDAIAFKLRWS